jgi:hypothetical protein
MAPFERRKRYDQSELGPGTLSIGRSMRAPMGPWLAGLTPRAGPTTWSCEVVCPYAHPATWMVNFLWRSL